MNEAISPSSPKFSLKNNIVDNMYKFKIKHAGKMERGNINVKNAKNPMSFEK